MLYCKLGETFISLYNVFILVVVICITHSKQISGDISQSVSITSAVVVKEEGRVSSWDSKCIKVYK